MAFRPGTRRNHFTHWRLYFAFCGHFNLPDLPATTSNLVLFAEFLARSFRAPKSITNALASLRHLHRAFDFDLAPFEAYPLTLFVRALPLTLRHTPNPAPPCTLAQLKRLVAALDTMGLGGLVLKALCLTGFYGFARVSSLVPPGLPFDSSRYPTLTDVQQAGKGLLLRIKFAKNAQDAAQWFAVPLLPLKCSPCCPVLALRRLCQLAQPAPPSTPLFRWPVRTATGELVLGGPLTAPVARRWFSVALREAGLAGANLTFHSLRRGACTLASQRGAQFHQLQASGNWRSDAVRSYFSPLPDRLRVAGLLASS